MLEPSYLVSYLLKSLAEGPCTPSFDPLICEYLRHLRIKTLGRFAAFFLKGKKKASLRNLPHHHHPKTDVGVTGVGIAQVTVCTAGATSDIAPRTTS